MLAISSDLIFLKVSLTLVGTLGMSGVSSFVVVGSTKEEIDASYEKAKAKYDKIASKFATTTKEDTPLIPKVPTNVNEAFKNIKPEDIANMSAKEWKEHRKTLGLK
jgi:uncharacterized membrane protein YgaE (UPF0421/DUF939 family)